MAKLKVLLVFLLTFFWMENVWAEEVSRAVIFTDTGSAANVRKGPGTQNTRIAYAQAGGLYKLVSEQTYPDTNNHKNCSKDWYQIYYNGIATGYVCGDHVEIVRSYTTDDVAPQTSCEQEMANLGFPSSYWGGLCNIKSKHANWSFTAVKSNISWPDVINRESACGVNLIYNLEENNGFIDKSCNIYGNTYVGVLPHGVAYYMDPRNFLSERYIFQFMHLAYDNNFASNYPDATLGILKDTAVYNYHKAKDYDMAVGINNVGHTMNVSPIFIATRIRQELGTKESEYNLYSGVYPGYENLYNFYNIGVTDGCVQSYGREYCGLEYARKNGWNTVDAAIAGGVSFLANSYINNTQYTGYFQKFDVNRENVDKIGGHQYMTNIDGARSEADTTFTTYRDMNLLNSAFNFYIPVYSNMDAVISNVGSGATGENAEVNLSASSVATIVTSSGYRYDAGYISHIAIGSDIADLIGTLESISGYGTVQVKSASGEILTSGLVATGQKVTITTQNGSETLTIFIKGDTSGDGKIDVLDLLQVQKNILAIYYLENESYKAADTSGDGAIDVLDLLQIQKNILGISELVQ